MAIITRDLDDTYPDWDWYSEMFHQFVEDAASRGIEIPYDFRQTGPGISFSGFSSPGDGLAFDCSINWLQFFESHEDFKTARPEWYLLLVANPDYIDIGTARHSRGNTMYVDMTDRIPDVVEAGFFAGVEFDDRPRLVDAELEGYVLEVCESEASDMYQELREDYEYLCDDLREQRIESLIEDYCTELRDMLRALPELFSHQSAHDGGIDGYDLDNLGLIECVGRGQWQLTAKGRGLISGEDN